VNFFKLELINRESSYNKVFGASPNVGVLNPFQNQQSRAGTAKGFGFGIANR